MRHRTSWLLLTSLSCALACSTPPARPVPTTTPSQPARTQKAPSADLTLPVPLDAPKWSDAEAAPGARRVALLVAADSYAEPAWAIRFARPSIDNLAGVFRSTLQFDKVEVLSGDRVYSKNVKAALRRLTQDLGTGTHVLYLHWVGHGFNIEGREQLLTYHSHHDGRSYVDALPYDRVVSWLTEAKRAVGERNGELRTAVVIDACRVRELAAPQRVADHTPRVDVEAFSAELGRPAEAQAGAEQSAFTAALCDSLKLASGRHVGLRPALLYAKERCANQKPEITTGERDVVLLDRGNLALRVVVVGQLRKQAVTNAVVELNGQRQSAPASFSDLAEAAEGFDLRVSAPGHFWRTDTIKVQRDHVGRALVVPLLPAFVQLQGTLVLASGAGPVTVRATGDFGHVLVANYHATAVTLLGGGSFALQVPYVEGPRSLVFERGGQALHRIHFDLATMPSFTRKRGAVAVPTYDFSTVSLEVRSHGSVSERRIERVVFGTAQRLDFSVLRESDFVNPRAWAYYRQSADLAQAGKLKLASRNLASLIKTEQVVAGSLKRAQTLQDNAQVYLVLEAAEDAYNKKDLHGALRLLGRGSVSANRSVRARMRELALAIIGDFTSQKRFGTAIAYLKNASNLLLPSDRYADHVRELYVHWLQQQLTQAMQDDSWPAVNQVLRWALRDCDSHAQLGQWHQRITEESMPLAAHNAYQQAVRAVRSSELENAWQFFEQALDEGANPTYTKRIEEQLGQLRTALFQKYSAVAAAQLAAGDDAAALVTYVTAYRYDPLAKSSIDYLLNDRGLGVKLPRALHPRVADAKTELASARAAYHEGRVVDLRRALRALERNPFANPREARSWLRNTEDAAARFEIGRLAIENLSYTIAHTEINKAVSLRPHFGEALFVLGTLYEDGKGIDASDKRNAKDWYLASAKSGYADAQYWLAVLFLHGKGVPKNALLAADWLEKAAGQGHVRAQAQLAELYREGRGVVKDNVLAARYLYAAAMQGEAKAAALLGQHYTDGLGLQTDLAEAARWYRVAAEAGDVGGQKALASALNDGYGTPCDVVRSAYWIQQAAEQNDAYALFNLAERYRFGSGVEKNLDYAKELYRRAIEAGDVFFAPQRLKGLMEQSEQTK